MISIIVPVYQVEPYLRQCIDSILIQTYQNIEILLINDGSPDRGGEICDEFSSIDPRIRVFHIPHQGLSAARNVGLQEARGEYIAFVDSDDWIEPRMLEVLLNRLEQTSSDIALCGYIKEDEGKETVSIPETRTYNTNETLIALFNGKIGNAVWNKLYKRKLFDTIRFPDNKNYEDISIQHLLFNQAEKVSVIEEPLYHYCPREGSITKSFTAQNLLDYADACFARYKFFDAEKPELLTQADLLHLPANGIARVWRWWYGCDKEEKTQYRSRIEELKTFTRTNLPLCGYPSWRFSLRLSTFFMHSDSQLSFKILYYLNQLYGKIRNH